MTSERAGVAEEPYREGLLHEHDASQRILVFDVSVEYVSKKVAKTLEENIIVLQQDRRLWNKASIKLHQALFQGAEPAPWTKDWESGGGNRWLLRRMKVAASEVATQWRLGRGETENVRALRHVLRDTRVARYDTAGLFRMEGRALH